MKSRTVSFLIVSGLSLLLYLGVGWWPMAYSLCAASWCGSVIFFAFAWFAAFKWGGQLSLPVIGLAVMLGRILPVLPLLITDISSIAYSLIALITCLVSILLALMCYSEKRSSVYILSVALILLLNTVVLDSWVDWLDGMHPVTR